ncbi:hypothetical protein D3C71_1684500 [compost metagenome]
MFKNYKPMAFFGTATIILVLISLILGIPLFIEYFETGLVTRFPTGLLATGIAILSMISFAIGVILDTCVRQHKENMEILRTINKNK